MDINVDTGISIFTLWGMRILSAALILIAGWIVGNYAKRLITGNKRLDGTLKSFLGGLAKYAILAMALVMVLGQFGIQTASLIAVLGAAGLAIGLALQGTLSNVASGVMLLILRPFNVGDYIEASGIGGSVKSLGLFVTELNTPDNVFIAVPNSSVWNSSIKNYSRNTQRRLDIAVSISYDDDIDKAFQTVNKVLKADKRLIITEGKEPQVMVSAMGASSVDMIVRVWMKASDYWDVKWDLTKSVKEALDKDGITIPFPSRTVYHVGEEKPAANSSTPATSGKKSKKKAA